ncbi:unnamed protein product (macronuclear) [Paramecium tetraurelia]|uniref:Uncharacterized protein n=1 Tax=Paramecium tetraurelia TaxID=5888 RepID=A0CTQ5_PARTE|nr:uncharacterized protein GSPATT00010406001 [Paramecium tetraurelia]CAK74172.1 unnamed protein product [Paramecium tetraurelia]|eukprot:XP_001441569.1 hypothetical protein (macronuclear) [Paramecium tetraurelia strain d4-2]
MKIQPNKHIQTSQKLYESAFIVYENQGSINKKKCDIKETDDLMAQETQISRRLQGMVNDDELQNFINRKYNIPSSPFRYIKKFTIQRKTQSLMNSPRKL